MWDCLQRFSLNRFDGREEVKAFTLSLIIEMLGAAARVKRRCMMQRALSYAFAGSFGDVRISLSLFVNFTDMENKYKHVDRSCFTLGS